MPKAFCGPPLPVADVSVLMFVPAGSHAVPCDPMAIEYAADELTADVDISDGEGYISIRGSQWNRVEEQAQSNLCIKAYSSAR